jgi:hypothetical protein
MTTPLNIKTLSIFFINMTILLSLPYSPDKIWTRLAGDRHRGTPENLCSRDKIWMRLAGDRHRGTPEHEDSPWQLGEGEDGGVVLTGVEIGRAHRSGHNGGAAWELASARGERGWHAWGGRSEHSGALEVEEGDEAHRRRRDRRWNR